MSTLINIVLIGMRLIFLMPKCQVMEAFYEIVISLTSVSVPAPGRVPKTQVINYFYL